VRIDSVSFSPVPFPCDELIVRIISNGFTWDSTSSSIIFVDRNGEIVCPVDFCVADDVIIAIYCSSFVKPIVSLAFHTLVRDFAPSRSFLLSAELVILAFSFCRRVLHPWFYLSKNWICSRSSLIRFYRFRFEQFGTT
jgi:hypothetical protein